MFCKRGGSVMGIVVCDVLMMGKEGTSGSGVCLQGAACYKVVH